MRKPVIGIITSRIINNNNPFQKMQKFTSEYAKMIVKSGGIPIGILFPNGRFLEEELDLCDGFILQGGALIYSAQVQAIHYILKSKKPALGICLGMQTMIAYDWLYQKLNGNINYKLIDKHYKKDDEDYFLDLVSNHNKLDPFDRRKIEISKHKVYLNDDSYLRNIYDINQILVASVHNYAVKEEVLLNSNHFDVAGRDEDGVIEVIESKDKNHFFVGTQFHPELEEANVKLFKKLVNECKKEI